MDDTAYAAMLDLTAQIVAAHVESNQVAAEDLPGLIQSVYRALATAAALGTEQAETPTPIPAVPIKRSAFPDYIICLEDGRTLKTLKRHLRTSHNLSTTEYRERWGLPPDYPMVAPNYVATRSDFAKKVRLGHVPAIKSDTIQRTESDHSGITTLPARRARGSRG